MLSIVPAFRFCLIFFVVDFRPSIFTSKDDSFMVPKFAESTFPEMGAIDFLLRVFFCEMDDIFDILDMVFFGNPGDLFRKVLALELVITGIPFGRILFKLSEGFFGLDLCRFENG